MLSEIFKSSTTCTKGGPTPQNQPANTRIRTKIIPVRGFFEVHVALEDSGWAMLQNSASLGRARRVVAEVNRGTYDMCALATALHNGAHVAAQVATNQLPATILKLLGQTDNDLTVQEIAELLEVEETRISQAIRKLLERCEIDRIYRAGSARYSSWGTQPRADNVYQMVLNSLRKHPRGLSIPKTCEYMAVHIPFDIPEKFREFVHSGVLEEVEDRQNRRKVYRIRK